MADTETAAPVVAESGKATPATTQEPALKPTSDNPSTNAGASEKPKVADSIELEPTNGNSPDKKRKLDDRDWRARRDEDNDRDHRDNRRGRGGSRGGGGGGNGGFRGGRGRGNYSNNVRTAYDAQPESSDPDEIRKQVEFYFSDSNLPTDRFLVSQVGGSANNAVPVKVIHSFKRMRHFQPYTAVVAALRESSTLDIEGAEGNEEIRRKTPLPDGTTADPEDNVEIFEDAARGRSIYAKGFGEEGPNTHFDIEAFFQPYGPLNAVRLRRTHPDKVFKGSVFVEFDSEETAKAFLALESKPKWEGKELKVSSKEEYVRGKAADVKHGRINSNSRGRDNRGRDGRGRGGRGGRGGQRGGRGGHRDRDGDEFGRSRRNRSRSNSGSRSRSRSPYRAAAASSEAKTSEARKEDKELTAAVAADKKDETSEEPSKKRARDDGAEEAQVEAKKAKTDDVAGA